jgi:hypothetical protein
MAAIQPIVAALTAPHRQQSNGPLVSIALRQSTNLACCDSEPLGDPFGALNPIDKALNAPQSIQIGHRYAYARESHVRPPRPRVAGAAGRRLSPARRTLQHRWKRTFQRRSYMHCLSQIEVSGFWPNTNVVRQGRRYCAVLARDVLPHLRFPTQQRSLTPKAAEAHGC